MDMERTCFILGKRIRLVYYYSWQLAVLYYGRNLVNGMGGAAWGMPPHLLLTRFLLSKVSPGEA